MVLVFFDLDGRRPITYAARGGHNSIKFPHLHLTATADIQIMLRYAVGRGDDARIMRLLSDEGAKINFQLPWKVGLNYATR